MQKLTSIFANFCGEWSFQRQATSSDQETALAELNGQAHFHKADETTLRYQENGSWLSLEQPIPFFRHYLYRLDQGQISVYYNDGPQTGNLYQSYTIVDDDRLVAAVSHVCGQDRYDGFYQFNGNDNFTMVQTIFGPRKNHRIITDFCRLEVA